MNTNIFDNLYNEYSEKSKLNNDEINLNNDEDKKNNDYELLKNYTISSGGDFSTMIFKLIKQFNVKIALLIFIFYVLYNSDIFNTFIVSKIDKNFYINDKLTERGLFINGILLSITYIILDLLNNNGYI